MFVAAPQIRQPCCGCTDWKGKERDKREKDKKERERFSPVVIQLCVSGLRVWISVIHIITGIGILKITQHKSKGSNCKTQPSVVTENTLDFFLALLRCTPT